MYNCSLFPVISIHHFAEFSLAVWRAENSSIYTHVHTCTHRGPEFFDTNEKQTSSTCLINVENCGLLCFKLKMFLHFLFHIFSFIHLEL